MLEKENAQKKRGNKKESGWEENMIVGGRRIKKKARSGDNKRKESWGGEWIRRE